MTQSMRAAVVRQFGGPLTIEERPVPTPARDQVLVRVVASGVCHTDLHAADGDWPVKPSLPFVPGHEGAGFVAAVGADVVGVKEGDRVGVPWLHRACGRCEYCLTGWETLCPNQQNTGYSVDGCYADYVLAPGDFVGKLPDRLGFAEAAPILCAGVTTYKGLKETEARPGEGELVLARRLGAELTVNAATEDPVAAVQSAIGGAHGALITAVSPVAFGQGIGMLRRGGTCSLVGLPPGAFPTPIFDVVLKRLTVRGSIVGTRRDLDEALAFAGEGKVRATIAPAPLESINDIFARLKSGSIDGRIVLALA